MKCYLFDRHIALAAGMRAYLRAAGDEVVDRSHSGHWFLHNSKPPKAEWREWSGGVYDAGAYAERAEKMAAEEARHKPDFYFCAFPPHLFTLFEKRQAPTVCNMGFRLEGNARPPADQFDILIEKALAGMESGKLRMYSMSQYDRAYFKWFTGKDAPYLPTPMNHMKGLRWSAQNAVRADILLWCGKFNLGDGGRVKAAMNECSRWFEANSDIRLTTNPFFESNSVYRKIAERPMIARLLKSALVGFRPANIRHPRLYLRPYRRFITRTLAGFSYQDLLRFKAIVMFPYSVFSGMMLELLEMGVPMFYPSKILLKRWDEQYGIMTQRTSAEGKRNAGGFSNVAYGKDLMPDPNDSVNPEALHYWLEKAEWYNWDVRYFDSPADLHEQLKAADFEAMHRDVLKTRARMDKIRDERWAEIKRDLTKTA